MKSVHLFLFKPPIGLATLLLLLLVFASCEKEALEEKDAISALPENYLSPSCSECGENCYISSVLEAIHDPEDADNDRINMILYHYGTALRTAFKKPAYQALILDALIADTEEATSLLTLAQEHPDFGDYFNAQLRQSMAAKNIYPRGVEEGIDDLIASDDWDANKYLTEQMTKEGYRYEPVVYEMAMAPVLSVNTVTFLIAQEVNDCDDVAGWTGDTEVLVSEEQVKNAEGLVLFVGPGKTQTVISTGAVAGAAQERDEQLKAVSGKIKGLNYRYEKSGKSEIVAFVVGWEEDPANPVLEFNSEAYTKFTKNQIKNQNIVSINRSIGGIIESANSANMFLGFYEYDWYISSKNRKKVKCPCNSSVPDAQLSMKYSNEWYNTDKFCGNLATLIPSPTGSRILDNKKGTFVLKRQPL